MSPRRMTTAGVLGNKIVFPIPPEQVERQLKIAKLLTSWMPIEDVAGFKKRQGKS